MKEFADIKNSIGLHVAQCMQAQILIRYKKFASIKKFIGLYVVHNQVQVHLNVACIHKYEEFTELNVARTVCMYSQICMSCETYCSVCSTTVRVGAGEEDLIIGMTFHVLL